ncbi:MULTISPECIES: hypothetical protein [Actinomycetes]|uniref:Fis family transcriptional regulator n=2 Tax=Actinomycetes TaxID=1760 RepID=A0ABP6M466_9MICC
MRWDALFADLESQWAGEASAELGRDIAEFTRHETASVDLGDRLRAALGETVAVTLPGGRVVELSLGAVGEEWIAGAEGHHGVVIPRVAVQAIDGLPRRAERERSSVRRRLGMAAVLRRLARDRLVVEIRGTGGEVLVHGLLLSVGRDHCEVALTIAGEVPRLRGARGLRTVPFAAMSEIRAEGRPPV